MHGNSVNVCLDEIDKKLIKIAGEPILLVKIFLNMQPFGSYIQIIFQLDRRLFK